MKDKRFDIAALGELLIDFTQYGISEVGQRLFEQNPGGAPANVVCAAARLDVYKRQRVASPPPIVSPPPD